MLFAGVAPKPVPEIVTDVPTGPFEGENAVIVTGWEPPCRPQDP
jgi:hypothetical protein